MGRIKFPFLFSWVGDNVYFCNMDKYPGDKTQLCLRPSKKKLDPPDLC